MRQLLRQSATFLAIYTIALHTILWGFVTQPTTNAFDPSIVICHSGVSTPSQQTPDRGPLTPADACDQCNLCNAVVFAIVADTRLMARFEPVQTEQFLHAVGVTRRDEIAGNRKVARGPPAFA